MHMIVHAAICTEYKIRVRISVHVRLEKKGTEHFELVRMHVFKIRA
jgi:hypothetical protein